jgi:catechol 2,3-dioxygenase-like lactoylglutathione lyase family enzyme
MRIGLTSMYVDDQDRAERFYTEVLGFQVTRTDHGAWLFSIAQPTS